MSRVLIVEDDETLSFSIEYTLKGDGFEVMHAFKISEAIELLKKFEFNLILLDVKLPDGTGYELCKEVKKKYDIPIIFLTACDEEVNIVTGLDMGADDYITKPFRIRELISRIRAVLRRNSKNLHEETVISSGDITVYTLLCKVKKGSTEVVLTPIEYRLLLTFMKHPKKVLERNVILEGLWDCGGEFVDDNTLSVYIRRLREKIEDNAAEPNYIVTLRGLGYKWNIDVRG